MPSTRPTLCLLPLLAVAALTLADLHAQPLQLQHAHAHQWAVPHGAHPTFMQPVLLHNFQVQGLSAEHMAHSLRRRHLPAQVQLECIALDSQLPTLKLQVRRAKADAKPPAQAKLDAALNRFQTLRC